MSAGKVTGLASGFDTQSIVDSLMSLEKVPYNKLDVKKQTEEVKLQAYQAINTYLLKFRTSMNTLSSKKLWNANACVSTNDKILTATANEYAQKGSYNFRVAQLATAAQYMSKSFTSKTSPLVKQTDATKVPETLGNIDLASGKTRVDNSAKLDTLNGGKGIFRGSVRVTDGAGNSSIIDLSACDTMDDVVRTLNESSGAQINAYVNEEGRLCVADVSNGSGNIRIQNVGTGTTAGDLGIAGTSDGFNADGKAVLTGENAYTLGSDMKLSQLNDGLGVEGGNIQFNLTDELGNYRTFYVNTEDCDSVGDIVKRLNDALAAEAGRTSLGTGEIPASKLADMRFAISDDKTSFALTGVGANMTVSIGNRDGYASNASPADDLGLSGRFTTGSSGGDINFNRVLGGVNSPMLKTLGGVNGSGVGALADPDSDSGKVVLPFNENTLVSTLNGGKGLDTTRPLQIMTWEGGADGRQVIHEQVINPASLEAFLASDSGRDKTVAELLDFMNAELEAYAANPANDAAGLVGMKFSFDSTYGCVAIEGAQAGYAYDVLGTAASALGLTRHTSLGTTIGLDPDSFPEEKDLQDAIDKFYGKGYSSLLANNEVLDEDSAMGSLLALAGLNKDDFTDIEGGKTAYEQWVEASELALPAKLGDLFGSGGSFTIAVERKDGTTANVSVDWDDVATKLGSAVDENTNVNDFMDAMNAAIEDAFSGVVDSDGSSFLVPKITANNYDNGFMWSGVDLSRNWEMTGLDALNLDRDTADIAAQNSGALTMGKDMAPGQAPSPMTNGYYVVETFDENTPLSQVNYMAGFSITPDQEIVVGFGDAGGIVISTNDIIAGLQGTTNPTVQDYLDILNGLAQDGLDGLNAANGGVDPISFEFAVVDGGIGIKDLANAEKLSVGGTAIGIGSVGLAKLDEIEVEDGSTHGLGKITAVSYQEKTVAGIGQIALSIGSDEDVIYLNTDGIDKNSTLNELIAKLNSELDRIAAGGQDVIDEYVTTGKYTAAELAELSKVRFSLNENGTGIAVDNGMKKAVTFHDTLDDAGHSDNQTLGQDLGLVNADDSSKRVESQSFSNAGTLNRQIISRATSLADILGENATLGSIRLTDSTGFSQTVGLGECKTVGDILDAINYFIPTGLGMQAQINAKGDGIEIIEGWQTGLVPPEEKRTGTIKIEDLDGGTTAKKLGIAGSGKRETEGGVAKIDGSTSVRIEVKEDDTLESLMYRIAESGNYKCAIVNSGTTANPQYRLSITAANTGEESDFVISCDVEQLGFTQTSRGRDAKVLYGDPSSNSSPILLSSSTNSNSSAINGLTLDLKSVSSEWTTITVDTDKDKVVEEIKNMVTAYNDLISIMSQLDGYDAETGEKGILFGDTAIRSMMDTINDYFYQIYDPDNLGIGGTVDSAQATWSWMDVGISLGSRNSNTDGSGTWFTTLELDEDKLADMVASNWETLSAMMAGERNAASKNQSENAKPYASFNGELEDGGDVENAINGNITKSGFGTSNGIKAKDTIANGSDSYTIMFQQPVTINRLSIYHESSSTALRDFVIEYMDPNTGNWEVLRNISGNTTDQNHLGFAEYPTASAIRITATSTNASDDKFRLLDVQVYEQTGLASKLNQAVNKLGDTTSGFLATQTESIDSTIADIKEQMARLQERLDSKEEALWRKFTTMETALGQLQNQGNYLTSMMSSMGNSGS